MPARDASVDTKERVIQVLAQALVVKTHIRTLVEQRFVVQDSVHLRGGEHEKGRIRRGGGRERERGRGGKGEGEEERRKRREGTRGKEREEKGERKRERGKEIGKLEREREKEREKGREKQRVSRWERGKRPRHAGPGQSWPRTPRLTCS
jgi:hypothetical protein